MSKTKDTGLAVQEKKVLSQVSDYGDNAGVGFENTTAEDQAIPFLSVLQAISPEVAGEPGKRIKGASAGSLVNTVTKEIFDGDAGVVFQPCATQHVYVEWKPRTSGGGFVAVHGLDSAEVKNARASQEFGKYKTSSGNDLIETYYMAGILHRSENLDDQVLEAPEPLLLAFTSTKIKTYKQIMTRLLTVKGKPPLFAHRLRIKSVTEKNTKGTFSNFDLKPLLDNDIVKSLIPPRLGDDQHPLLVAGKALMNAYLGGEVKTNHDAQKAGEGQGGGAADVPF